MLEGREQKRRGLSWEEEEYGERRLEGNRKHGWQE